MAPGFAAYQRSTGAAIVEAVRRARPGHVVLLSSIGAHLPSGAGPISGLYPVEQGLRVVAAEGSVAVTLLRAGYFMENLGNALGALDHGLLADFVPVDAPVDMVATRDIGLVAASLLQQGGEGVQVIELGGLPAVTMTQCAAALSELLGKPIQAVAAPIETMVDTMTGYGFPPDFAALYHEMVTGMMTGRVQWEGGHPRLPAKVRPAEVLAGLLAAG